MVALFTWRSRCQGVTQRCSQYGRVLNTVLFTYNTKPLTTLSIYLQTCDDGSNIHTIEGGIVLQFES